MDFKQVIQNRFSCRRFLPLAVSNALIEEIITLAQNAPSAANLQPYKVIVLNTSEVLNKIYESYQRDWFKTAPVVFIICANKQQAWKRNDGFNAAEIDAAIFIDHLTLVASEMGLGTCWICNFDTIRCKQDFKIPDHIEPLALIPLGFPADNKIPQKSRKTLAEILTYNKL